MRLTLWLFGLRQLGIVAGGLLVFVVTTLAWYEHQQSGDNFFHKSLGANIWISVAAAWAFTALLEVLF